MAFQSTLPAWGATSCFARLLRQTSISIHAPRMGSDVQSSTFITHLSAFQSTLPAWGATSACPFGTNKRKFQSTLPAWGATSQRRNQRTRKRFQSTLPAWGATRSRWEQRGAGRNFNPRSPHGERQRKVTILSIRIIDFAQKVYHKTVLLRISLAENAVILPEKPRNPVRTSLQKAGGLRFARAIRAARPYSISSPSGA